MAGHFLPGYFSTHIGWSGVDLFFVLSGFFVSGILFREYIKKGRIRAGRFLIRRGLKIWPLFYTSLFIQLCYLYFKSLLPGSSQVLTEIFFIQNYFPGFTGVTWSLGVEEQFYILAALVFTFLLNYLKGDKKVVAFCTIICIVCLAARFVVYNPGKGFNPYKTFYPLHLRADSLCAGILISWLYHFRKETLQQWVNKNRLWLCMLSVLLLLSLFIFPFYNGFILTVGFTLTYSGYAVVTILMLFPVTGSGAGVFTTPLRTVYRFVAWVGFYSYAIYLFHVFIGFGVVNNFRKLTGLSGLWPLELIVFIAGNIIFGYFISRLVEQPVLRWRNRVYPD